MPPGHIAEMARPTLVGNVALTMKAPTGNPRFPPRPLRFSVIHTLWSTADPIASWYCYRHARTSQAFRFLFLNAVKSKFFSAEGLFSKDYFSCLIVMPTHLKISNTDTLTQHTWNTNFNLFTQNPLQLSVLLHNASFSSWNMFPLWTSISHSFLPSFSPKSSLSLFFVSLHLVSVFALLLCLITPH